LKHCNRVKTATLIPSQKVNKMRTRSVAELNKSSGALMLWREKDKEKERKEMNSKEGAEVRGVRLFYLEQLLF